MKTVKLLEVWMNGNKVGLLAETVDKRIAFEYDADWIKKGFSISPISLPLEKKVFISKAEPFEGLYGVFADSLPDGWGRLLVDRMLLKQGVNPQHVSALQRLAIVGSQGMGALEYRPAQELSKVEFDYELDKISEECKKVLSDSPCDELDKLYVMGGSSGGARPKVNVRFKDEDWLVKFPSSYDDEDIGYQEYRYALCASKCDIDVEEVHLFSSKKCKGYFGTRRFDRNTMSGERVHMITVSGMLETSHRIPNLDYNTLMRLIWIITKDDSQLKQMYRRMCFNTFSHNRDDHSKNFSFLYDSKSLRWKLTPAYDMTYSSSVGGEHATCVAGNGVNPGMKELISVGVEAGLSREWCEKVAGQIREIVTVELGEYLI